MSEHEARQEFLERIRKAAKLKKLREAADLQDDTTLSELAIDRARIDQATKQAILDAMEVKKKLREIEAETNLWSELHKEIKEYEF